MLRGVGPAPESWGFTASPWLAVAPGASDIPSLGLRVSRCQMGCYHRAGVQVMAGNPPRSWGTENSVFPNGARAGLVTRAITWVWPMDGGHLC